MSGNVIVDESVEGMRVLNEQGENVGIVTAVRNGTAYVDPDPGIAETLMSKLGWSDADADDYPLPEESIERITDDAVHLRSQV